ncbi:MAG TPA: 3-isopropylmalate dehydrogenase [Gemmatimonadaceae bacterium]|nr:3-isopropylmalate dehydrogenase [Gemmatimonadaceae bacterium]
MSAHCHDSGARDASVRDATIALLSGDGIGPEVTDAARRVLEAVAERFAVRFRFREALIGGAAIDAVGDPFPAATRAECAAADAVLLGAVGGPKWDDPSAAVRPEQGLLALRRTLGLFANLRPVAPLPALYHASPLRPERLDGVDLLVVRELTGGIYFGSKTHERHEAGEQASDLCAYHEREIVRVVRVAAALARERRGRLTSVDKANVLETSRLWRRVATRVVADEFPDVMLDHLLVDSCAMHLVQRPSRFDVIVTENMFGDILTDEAAVLAGSIGVLPSASLGDPEPGRTTRRGVYEPIHGSAPDLAGRGEANPIGTILSAALLLRHSLGLEEEATVVEEAVKDTVAAGVLTPDVAVAGRGATTGDVVESVVARVLGREVGTAPSDGSAVTRT